MLFTPQQFNTNSLHRLPKGKDICQLLAAAMNSADAESAIHRKVFRKGKLLHIDQTIYDLSLYNRIFLLGAGKAIVPMVKAICEILGDRITSGILITKEGYIEPSQPHIGKQVRIIQAGHPIPDQRNLDAVQEIFTIIRDLQRDDLVICLISGGGSSLLVKPAPGISLENIQETTELLLKSGATIDEMNVIRKHLDDFKGGNFAKLISPTMTISLILSDVIGDNLDMVASGPTVADPSTFRDARTILEKYQLLKHIPPAIRSHLEAGINGMIPETVKPGDSIMANVSNYLIGNNTSCVHAALLAAEKYGFYSQLLTTTLHGEASQVGKLLVEDARARFISQLSFPKPLCLIGGGETTVTIHGDGKGGRNQELVLGAVKSLSGPSPIILISLATDGGDGPTDAAGAVATNQTYKTGLAMDLDPDVYLHRNDAYHYFERLGDLIKTGPTLTNVNDLVFIFVL